MLFRSVLYLTDGPLSRNVTALTLIQYDMTIKEIDDLMCNKYPTKFFQTMVYTCKLDFYQQRYLLNQNLINYQDFIVSDNETYLVLKTDQNTLDTLIITYKQFHYMSISELLFKLNNMYQNSMMNICKQCCYNKLYNC